MTDTATAPAFPMTICPAWPIAVERGKPGICAYGTRVASVSESANAPRPEPRIRPIVGRNAVCESRNWAADSARVKRALGDMENPLGLRATSFELRKRPSAISHQELSHKATKV